MTDLVTYMLFTISVLIFVCLLKNKLTKVGRKYPNGPFGLPILGHLPFFGRYPPATFYKWWKQYGDIVSVKLGSWNAVVVNGISAIKEVTCHPKDAFNGRPKFVSTEIFNERNGEETLIFGNFSSVYVKQQRMTARALRLFTAGRPEIVEEIVSLESNIFVDNLLAKSSTVSGYIEFDVQTLVVRFTYQLLYGQGKEVGIDKHVKVLIDLTNKANDFMSSGSAIDVMPWLRYVMPWKISWFRKVLFQSYGIHEKQVQEHYETFSRGVIKDVADAIIASDADDEQNSDRFVLSRARLDNTLWDLQSAGIDTSQKTLIWLLLYMTAYPEVQERVHEEIEAVVKGRKVALKDKRYLPFTEAVYLEVNRRVTLVPFALPHYAIMDAKIGDFDIDEGTVVLLNIHSVHHDKEFWGDPENFRPDRFLTSENMLDAVKCSRVVPFGIGRRRCIGEALAKIATFMSFATIMQRCDFIKPPGEVLDLTQIPGISYHPKDFRVLVKERSKME